MVLKTAFAACLVLVASSLPSEAGQRTVHLFGETFVFNFAREFAFTKRIDTEDGKRQTVTFTKDNRSIVVSASRYDAAKTEPLLARDEYLAKVSAENAREVKYINEETEAGRGGSHMYGFCKDSACLYRMGAAIGQKYWISILVICEACSERQIQDTGVLADTLYQQVKKL